MPPKKRVNRQHGTKSPDSKLPTKSMDGKVKEFGKKARALLQEEKEKRREIKVVEHVGHAEKKTSSSTSFGSAIKSAARVTTATARPNKKQGGSSPSKRRRSEGSSKPASKIHNHAPHIPIPEKEFRSNIVKLHGLHPLCTVEHVKKFFSGLKIDFAFTVPSNDVYIPLLDCKKDLQETRDSDSDHHLRIFVKFESSTLATVAAERSGETIEILFGETNEPKKLSIGVTLMTKELGRRMLEMSIQGNTDTSFSEIHSSIEQELHPIVSTVLWKMVANCIDIPLESKMIQHDLFRKTSHDASTLQGYQELARHCNQLIEIHEILLNQLPSMDALTSELSNTNPTARLTSTAASVLANEVSRLYTVLRQGRFEARIQREIEAKE